MPELADCADANFVVHAAWAATRTPGMQVFERPELVMVDSGVSSDTFNIICRARITPQTVVRAIRNALAYYAVVGRPFSWWLGPGDQPADLGRHLEHAGLQRADSELAMAASLADLPASHSPPPGLEIRRVRNLADLDDFAHVIANPDERRFYSLTAPAQLAADCPHWRYVGYLEGTPVASAELTIGGGVVGLYNIATLEPYRRRGIGRAMTLQPLLDARAAGHRIGVLQATDAGARVYRRTGFETFGEIAEYKITN